MKKQIKIILMSFAILSMAACEEGGLLSPARDVNGIWKGTLTSSENNAEQINTVTNVMVLDLTQDGNNVTGDMCYGSYCGSLTGTISGATINFTSIIGNGCINVHGTFTSSNMEGMRNSTPPPYLTCGDVLNDGHGSKGIEWHLVKL
jgi:hypothetical protein